MENPPLPPPPPPPKQGVDQTTGHVEMDEEDQAENRQFMAVCRAMEKARCHATDLEASLYFASTVLYGSEKVSDPSMGVAGGVQDAWSVVKLVSRKTDDEGGDDDKGADPSAEAPVISGSSQSTSGGGQLAVAVHRDALAGSLQHASSVASEILQHQKSNGGMLARQIERVKELQEPDRDSDASSKKRKTLMDVFDGRMQELRAYHARSPAAASAPVGGDDLAGALFSSLAGGSGALAVSASNKRFKSRAGNPVSDGYDLAATLLQQLQPIITATNDDEQIAGEELLGKYLDLRSVYNSLKAMVASSSSPAEEKKKDSVGDYVDFLEKLSTDGPSSFSSVIVQDNPKNTKRYVQFLTQLQEYLLAFLSRYHPLLNVQETVIDPTVSKLLGEVSRTDADGDEKDSPVGIDLSKYDSADSLASMVDGEALKLELVRLGLKCGGTVQDRAKRLFMIKDKPNRSDWPSKIFAKKKQIAADASAPSDNQNNPEASSSPGGDSKADKVKVTVLPRQQQEAVLAALLNQLRPTLDATVRREKRRLTQTVDEQEKEVLEELFSDPAVASLKKKSRDDDDEDDSDDDAPIYNPKNVPLDWDGKPIPYWLFKLHGLNHYYECEICGGESYRGRRNFELHFADPKHAAGMRNLGIPNTKHFHGVVRIDDAIELWKSLEQKLKEDQFTAQEEEQFEDSHGNVLSRTAYEEMARQGLL